MKIYTKKGDTGETSLIGGVRVKKSNVRIHAYGTVDELNSVVGLVRDSVENKNIIEQLLEIQDRLFVIGSHLASASGSKMKLPDISSTDIQHLENYIDEMNDALPELKSFILPGGDLSVSYTHLARTVCRRAERWVIEVDELEKVDSVIIEYLNRLSDYFFMLGRKISLDNNAEEIPWKPRID
jgi:cob(I)alamin adenosyltransferase